MCDHVSTEITTLAKSIGLVAEPSLFAALLFVDNHFTLVSSGLGDEDGLAVAAFQVPAHGRSSLVGAARDFEFVAGKRLVAFSDEQSVNNIANALSKHLRMVVAADF